MKTYNLQKYQDTIISCLKKAANTLMSLLRVKPFPNDYWISDSQLTRYNITHWEKEKFGNEAHDKGISLNSLGIDLVIFSRFENLEASTLASSSSIYRDYKSYQPYCGRININHQIDFSHFESFDFLLLLLFF